MTRLPFALLLTLLASGASHADAETPAHHAAKFGAGGGPRISDGVYHLLDAARTPQQSNAIAFDREHEGARARVGLKCDLRVLEGGDGGAIVFLNTREYGARGPAPFVKSWVEPNLRETFAVGIDVHNPPTKEPFGPWGNVLGRPQREISLHFDGREIVKRVAPTEFRGDYAPLEVAIDHVTGGAAITVELAGAKVYDRYFIAHMTPYELRLALGASTRGKATTQFSVRNVELGSGQRADRQRRPLHVEVFNHVLTNNKKTAYQAELDLPPLSWGFGRVIMTIDIHDAGKDWDEWDRNGEVSIFDDDGTKRGIVPFITSYRTPCHWKVDVTHFRPFLTGKRKIEIAAGTTFYKNRGYMLSVSLDFHHGTPELLPQRVIPIWVGTARYRSAENHFQDFFEPKTMPIEEGVKAARLFVTTTGHSQIGEFTPSKRTIVFAPVASDAPIEARYENTLWKDDCYLNPNRPQSGTWKYPRAGWAPGDVVRPWEIDLTPHLRPGNRAELRYEPEPYDFSKAERTPEDKQINAASHVVRAYLVLYGSSDATRAAPVLRVANVAKDSNAAMAGMKAGDYLAEYDGAIVDSVDDLRAALKTATEAGKAKVTVVAFRGAKRMELELDAGKMGIGLGQ